MGDQESSDEEQVDGIRGIIAQMLPFFCTGSFLHAYLKGRPQRFQWIHLGAQ